MGINKKNFNAVWERVKDAVNGMPELKMNSGTSNTKKTGASVAERDNPWASIWELGGTKFEFGDWDTFEEMS
jgi:hypothetical protein